MKIIDIREKPVIYSKNLGDEYYWDYKLIVKIDDDNYCLINYDDSFSGYIEFNMECVDEEFISAFMVDYMDEFIKFDRCYKTLDYYISDYNLGKVRDVDVILIPKEKIQKYLDLFDEAI